MPTLTDVQLHYEWYDACNRVLELKMKVFFLKTIEYFHIMSKSES